MDTMYGTNKYNFPAIFISTLDNRGKNIIVAVAFLKDEKKKLYYGFLKPSSN